MTCIFCPVHIRIKLSGVKGKVIYEHDYSQSGTAMIMYDESEKKISFVDTNIMGPLRVVGVRAFAVYDLTENSIAQVVGFDNSKNQYGYIPDYSDLSVLIAIQIPKMENGRPDIDLFQFGISRVEQQEQDLVFQKRIEDEYVFARCLS